MRRLWRWFVRLYNPWDEEAEEQRLKEIMDRTPEPTQRRNR